MAHVKRKRNSVHKHPRRVVTRIVEAIVRDPMGRVLILKRSPVNTIYVGKWQFPGGKAERGESAIHAIKREIKEETNCSCSNLKVVKKLVFSEWFRKKYTRVELVIFSCKIRGKICLSEDHTAHKFVKANGVLKKILAPISQKALFSKE
jgi:mutator protein MutT